jgi:hypothetical protein
LSTDSPNFLKHLTYDEILQAKAVEEIVLISKPFPDLGFDDVVR